MTRTRSPARRPSLTGRATWQTEAAKHRFHITAGYDPMTGRLCEVFYADGQKTGTNLRDTVQDACILISMLLQHGETVNEIGKSLNVAPVAGTRRPASILGTIVETLRGMEVQP